MPHAPPSAGPRSAVVDLGSNSVRLVVFEGHGRNPLTIFNEKAVLRLGKGLQGSGRLNDEAVAAAMPVMQRYHAVGRAMGVETFEVLATAAVRDAANGPAFVASLGDAMPGVPIRILSGEEEAALSAAGLLCGIPAADGVLADIGGGSLELVQVAGGGFGQARSLPLGVIRLGDRAEGDLIRARLIADADLGGVGWLGQGAGRDLYLVGGAFRALARIHLMQNAYPINIVHQYAIEREAAREFAASVAGSSRRILERLAGAPRRRVDDLPLAAIVLRRLLRATSARRVVFSANGIREGWYMQARSEAVRAQEPLLAAGQDMARQFGRDPALPPALAAWTAPLFPDEGADARRQREAACWMSDIGAHDHPEYRAEQAYLRVLRQPGVGLDHPTRAFLALTLALRYEAESDAPFLTSARSLLDPAAASRAEVLGTALRLAYTLSAGTPDLLGRTALQRDTGRLTLRLSEGGGVFAGESILRRLGRLAGTMGLEAKIAHMSA